MNLRSLLLACLAIWLCSPTAHAQSSYERELKQLTEKRDKALTTSTQEINRQYQKSLQDLLARASKNNDAATVAAIAEALKGVGGNSPVQGGGAPTKSLVSIRLLARPSLYVQHARFFGVVQDDAKSQDPLNLVFERLPGLSDSKYVSFRSVNYPDRYLSNENSRLQLVQKKDTDAFRVSASFKEVNGLKDARGVSFEASNLPGFYIYAKGEELWIGKGVDTAAFAADATFSISQPKAVK